MLRLKVRTHEKAFLWWEVAGGASRAVVAACESCRYARSGRNVICAEAMRSSLVQRGAWRRTQGECGAWGVDVPQRSDRGRLTAERLLSVLTVGTGDVVEVVGTVDQGIRLGLRQGAVLERDVT